MNLNKFFMILLIGVFSCNQNSYAGGPQEIDCGKVVPAYIELIRSLRDGQNDRLLTELLKVHGPFDSSLDNPSSTVMGKVKENEEILARHVLVQALTGDRRRQENYQNTRAACYALFKVNPAEDFGPASLAVFKDSLTMSIAEEDPRFSMADYYKGIINRRLSDVGPVPEAAIQGVKARISAFEHARTMLELVLEQARL